MISCAYFVQGAGPNQNSRYGLVRALVEDRTVQIDAYQTTTSDISTASGHWYCDKAPGLSLAATIPYALGVRFAQPDAAEPSGLAIHLLTLATCSLATAVAAVLLLYVLVSLGVGLRASLLAIVGWLFGSNAFAYAGLFLAHQFAAALIVIALAGIRAAERCEGRRWLLMFGAGGAAGLAVISEFPVGFVAGAIGVYALASLGLRRTAPYALGALIPAIVLAVYNTACFGNALHIGYQSLVSPRYAAGVRAGILGFGAPDLHVIAELTIFEYRGLLPLSPFLILAVPGTCWMLRDRRWRRLGLLCLLVFLGLVSLISGFPFWNGGAAMGPRHLVPLLPFLIIPTAVAIDHLCGAFPRIAPPLVAALLAVSIAICTACVAVQPEFFAEQAPGPPAPGLAINEYDHPISQFVFPMLSHGYVSTKATRSGSLFYATLTYGSEDDAYNLGEVLGFSGISSLLPLLVVWFGFGCAFVRHSRACRGDNRTCVSGTHRIDPLHDHLTW
jgi:hypothetical protein